MIILFAWSHLVGSRQHLIEALFLFWFFSSLPEANEIQIGIVWMLKFQSQITVITRENILCFFSVLFILFFFVASFHNLLDRVKKKISIWKSTLFAKHIMATNFVVWSLFVCAVRVYVFVCFALHWMVNDSDIYTNHRFRINVFFEFSLSIILHLHFKPLE